MSPPPSLPVCLRRGSAISENQSYARLERSAPRCQWRNGTLILPLDPHATMMTCMFQAPIIASRCMNENLSGVWIIRRRPSFRVGRRGSRSGAAPFHQKARRLRGGSPGSHWVIGTEGSKSEAELSLHGGCAQSERLLPINLMPETELGPAWERRA